MKSLLPAILLLTVVTSAQAQNPDESVHQALRQLKTTMAKALNERDLDTIVANLDPNIVFTTMNNDVCRGPAEIRAYFQKMMTAPGHIVKNVTVSFDADRLTTLYGSDIGVAHGTSKDHYELTTGQKFDVNGRWSCTLVRHGDRWLIANFHYSTNVFDNPILNGVRRAILPVGIIAAIVGLALGIILGRLMARRKKAAA